MLTPTLDSEAAHTPGTTVWVGELGQGAGNECTNVGPPLPLALPPAAPGIGQVESASTLMRMPEGKRHVPLLSGVNSEDPKLGNPTFYFAILPFPVPHSQYPGYDPYSKFYPSQRKPWLSLTSSEIWWGSLYFA